MIELTVEVGFVTACLFAISPTTTSPLSLIFTTDGVVLAPSEFGIIVALPPSITATQEFVVPKSIPIILLILSSYNLSIYIYFLHTITIAGLITLPFII
ncbi:unknown [Fusobacterium nucleatum subsp. nucleatum ATCC 25586]|uniref:Uncharacterized protein n=1 Tax=Fusobacterium nucleatum subsp. nucleatum (strain ATCC 25586 / DSM 15643 / BCRC 10681 / CIP 101130 / JCM 8532 / KCTC 2640 / LMG 13131 / VPI 4355) TaxID=190304 RepID=Q8RH06_FUSNN|nr:unknown [Fusobacterium nucleatum subsp. nucleatum ATCC 25586]